MSSIHYKFRSLVSYKTVNFDTLHVSVEELKKAIFDAENLNPETFDLVIENSHTKREYSGKDIIPRNSSLIIKRVPRQDAAKLPKIQDTSTSGIVTKSSTNASDTIFMKREDFLKMSEEQRLDHVKQESYQKYDPSNYQRKARYTVLSDPPPPTYICGRCNQSGHWIKNCPLATIKRTTGLPIDELVETTADDPGAMLHPSGKYMVQKMHRDARLNSKAKAPILPFMRDSDPKPVNGEDENEKPVIKERPPAELICPICNDLINEAVVMSCCGSSFCAECVQNLIIEDPGRECAGDGCTVPLSVDSMIGNKSLRKAVENYKKKQLKSQWPGLTNRPNIAGGLSPAKIEKQISSQSTIQIVPTKNLIPQLNTESASSTLSLGNIIPDFSKPPPQIPTTNSVVILPDLTKPPPIFQSIPSSASTTQSKPTSSTVEKSPNEIDFSDSAFDQDFSTPPHVETPSHEETPPLNTTIPPGNTETVKKESPKRELSQEAIQAFSSFNPTGNGAIDLFASLSSDVVPPGVESNFSLFNKIDPISGQLLDSNGRIQLDSNKRHRSRSPVNRRRHDSRSPIRKGRNHSPSLSYRPYSLTRKTHKISPIRRPYSNRHIEDDFKRETDRNRKRERSASPSKHKKGKKERGKRSKSPSRHKKRRRNKSKTKDEIDTDETLAKSPIEQKSETKDEKDEISDPVDEDENVIDSLIKETSLIVSKDNKPTITIAPISNRAITAITSSSNTPKKIENILKEKPTLSQQNSSNSSSESSSRKSSSEKPAQVYQLYGTISIDTDQEIIGSDAKISTDHSPEPKEKLSRKKSGEKKAKKDKHKKKKAKKHKKEHRSEDSKSSKKKKSKKSSKEKKRHRSRSE